MERRTTPFDVAAWFASLDLSGIEALSTEEDWKALNLRVDQLGSVDDVDLVGKVLGLVPQVASVVASRVSDLSSKMLR
ncbi:hypothetical protein [Amaricoccus solimangrovi]|uniref:Uncharacterized protein n=1 Tax=Amaricoccus solimangrovi TaxID=2589815 RepID=A0A501WCR2_9RHOB|nr:hypothetical protein [Amaricoccus solimangrovi]TPE47178.1 hypothetical protein FJM51_20655 [Amaricoccus solimangrovi]